MCGQWLMIHVERSLRELSVERVERYESSLWIVCCCVLLILNFEICALEERGGCVYIGVSGRGIACWRCQCCHIRSKV